MPKRGRYTIKIPRLVHGLKLIIVNLLVLVAAFLFLEFSARLYLHLFVKGEHFFRETRFTSPWITSAIAPPPQFDSDGNGLFRHSNRPVKIQKEPNLVRIMAVGGSTTANNGPFKKAAVDYAIALERRLDKRQDGRTYEVLNAGADAYCTAQNLINIQFRLVEFHPDIIILMNNLNDLSANYFKSGATSDYSNKYMLPYYLDPELQVGLSLYGFVCQSRLLTKLGIHRILFDRRKGLSHNNSIEAGLRYFKRNLQYIIGVCEQHNIDLVLLSQPNSKQQHQFKIRPEEFQIYNDAIREVAEANKIAFVDMNGRMGHEGKFFTDFVHFTPLGIEKFARVLYPDIVNVIEKRRLENAVK